MLAIGRAQFKPSKSVLIELKSNWNEKVFFCLSEWYKKPGLDEWHLKKRLLTVNLDIFKRDIYPLIKQACE